jgi:serine/threonine protein kinase
MAPELLKEGSEEYDGPKVDIFAMGVMLFMLVEASFPFGDHNDIWYRRL